MPANTVGITSTMKTMIEDLQLNGAPAYAMVKIGTVKQLTVNLLPLMEITGSQDNTERITMDGVGQSVEIDDSQVFSLTTTISEDASDDAEVLLFSLRDLVTDLFHSQTQFNSMSGMFGVYVQHGKYGFSNRNGIWYRIHQIPVLVRYDYETILQP